MVQRVGRPGDGRTDQRQPQRRWYGDSRVRDRAGTPPGSAVPRRTPLVPPDVDRDLAAPRPAAAEDGELDWEHAIRTALTTGDRPSAPEGDTAVPAGAADAATGAVPPAVSVEPDLIGH